MLGRVDDASQTSWGKYALRGFCYNPCLGTEERRVSGAKQRQISCRGDSLELITNFRQHVSDPPWEQQSLVGVNHAPDDVPNADPRFLNPLPAQGSFGTIKSRNNGIGRNSN